MMLTSLVLAAVLGAQNPPPGMAASTAPRPDPAAVPAGMGQEHIDAGLQAFKKRHFKVAQGEFQKAVDADPQNAAANFYLGYTYYKIAEPTKRATAGKRKAAELFARAFELDPAFKPVWHQKG
jgi:Tfp pilus assembly protein PilF